MSKKLTPAQQRSLDALSETEFEFRTGSADRVCGTLESMGLVEGKILFAARDDVRGLTSYRRAYRRIPAQ